MKKFYGKSSLIFALVLVLAFIAVPITSSAKTEVYRLADDPFTWYQCYELGAAFGPADFFGCDVCVEYNALNSVTTRIKENKDGTTDVGWSLIQQGSATIHEWTNAPNAAGPNASGFGSAILGDLLYTGPFKVEEVGQDDGNDAYCVGTDTNGNPVAWLGKCDGYRYTTLDFMRYHWKISGNKVYFFEFRVEAPGAWCFLDSREVIIDGGGCPGP